MARLAATAVLLGLACAGIATAMAQATLTLVEARKAISAERSRLWKDPDSIREAKITAPHQCPYRASGSICVCVEANAKNAMGGYTGLTKTRVYFDGRRILDTIGPLGTAAPDQCGTFQPFPELNAKR